MWVKRSERLASEANPEEAGGGRPTSSGWLLAACTNCEFLAGAPSAGGPARILEIRNLFLIHIVLFLRIFSDNLLTPDIASVDSICVLLA